MSPRKSSSLRGVRKCMRCGRYNGNKARKCGNKQCGVIMMGNKKHNTTPLSTTVEGSDALLSTILASLDVNNISNLSFNDDFVDGIVEQLETAEIQTHDANVPQVVNMPSSLLPEKQTESFSVVENDFLTFIQWLSSVTERINQTVNFQFSGKPEPLVFHIPEVFFERLHKRMSDENAGKVKRRRLPNKTCEFVRKDSAPTGKFIMYTWRLYSLSLLSRIFDTPHIQLEIIKYYKMKTDGTYAESKLQDLDGNNTYSRLDESLGFASNLGQKIAPGTLVTFLKVGKNIQKPGRKNPFVIEWIPNILPVSKVGELRIKFEYGHKSNAGYFNFRNNFT